MHDRRTRLIRFYSLLDELEKKLGGARTLAACNGQMGWPRRGVYFFRENGEGRSDSGHGPRIVRVGTHALGAGAQTTLWNRLSQHRGRATTPGGNHRGSIFRLLIGNSLMTRNGLPFPSWGNGANAPREVRVLESALESLVSDQIGAMPFLWIAIDDDPGPLSLRGYVERNAIALLSNFDREPLDASSPKWLGHHCDRQRVRSSGLWNNNHVNEQDDPEFLDHFEKMIRAVQ